MIASASLLPMFRFDGFRRHTENRDFQHRLTDRLTTVKWADSGCTNVQQRSEAEWQRATASSRCLAYATTKNSVSVVIAKVVAKFVLFGDLLWQ